MLLLRVHINTIEASLDLTNEGVFKVCDQNRIRHVLQVLLEAEFSHLVHVLWLNVQLLVLAHENLTFVSECAASCLKVAAQLHKIKDSDQRFLPAAHLNELVDKFSHVRPSFIAFLTLAPNPIRVFVSVCRLLLWPKHAKTVHELEIVDLVIKWSVFRDKQEEHLGEEIVLNSENLVQILLHAG